MSSDHQPRRYYVIFVETKYASMQEALARAPETVAAHVARSRALHEAGALIMAGAFLDRPEEPLSTMGVLRSRAEAEAYIAGDPFALIDMIAHWAIRESADKLA